MTTKEKAAYLGISPRTLESWLQGRRKPSKLMREYLRSQDHDCGTPTGDGCTYCALLFELDII